MKLYKPAEAAFNPQGAGSANKVLHTDLMSLATWKLDKGTELAMHDHPQEQIAFVLQGRMEFKTPGALTEVGAGEQIVFASNEPHGGKALEDSIVLDIFSSVREDFKKKFVAMQPVKTSC